MRTVAIFLVWLLPAAVLRGQPSAQPASCSAPEYRQLDFWIGDWDVSDVGDAKPSMRIAVEEILAGCALKESYRDVNGMVGQSLSAYDASRRL